jgi:carbon monoxide dehydrogenase subunit G
MKVENSVIVDRASGDVFAFLSELENHVRFVPGLLEFHLVTELRPGAEAIGVRRAFGRIRRLPYHVTTFVADEAIGVGTRLGPLAGTVEYRLEPTTDGRTRVTMTSDYRAAGPLRLLDGILARMARRDGDIVIANLRRTLEAPA